VRLSADRWAIGTLKLWAIGCLLLAGSVSSASAAGTYVLDPNLSLTGNCETTKADPVPDPGCPEGQHPSKGFTSPRSVATDPTGNIYVASYGPDAQNGKEGRIDVFNPEGFFITELLEPAGPKDIAVDSDGTLYVFNASSGANGLVVRYEPSVYEPEAGKISYGNPAELVIDLGGGFLNSLAVAPSNDHLFVKRAASIIEFSSAAEENKVLDEEIGKGTLNGFNGLGLAIDEAHNRIYSGDNEKVRVLELGAPHKLLLTIEESDIPGGNLTSITSVAADETTGDFFIFDGSSSKAIYQFSEDGTYEATIKGGFSSFFGSEVSVDNSPTSPNQRYLFAPSEEGGVGIAFAFEPPGIVCEPEVESISLANVSEADAELRATINPCNADTSYVFEYITQQRFEEEGDFDEASIAGDGEVPAGANGIPVNASATGLLANTAYRFRVVATNEEGTDEAEGEFTTYLPPESTPPCANDVTRTGPSVLLPDCRAYELVTPPNTNARSPHGIAKPIGIFFASRASSPAGDAVSFITDGGLLPGTEGTGSLSGDSYLATRGATGWSSASTGPNGEESIGPLIGSSSPDQGHSFWQSSLEGTAAVEGKTTSYVRYPDGHSELVGQGSLGSDPLAEGRLISEGAGHVIFTSRVQLEEGAPAGGERAIYDRTSDGVTQVVSLLPNDVTPAAGQEAFYEGSSLDGEGVAFTFGATTPSSPLYLGHEDETYEVEAGATFAGIAEGGERIFYVKAGNLSAFDVESGTIPFVSSGDATVVNVSADGTAAYFVSPSVLGSGPNPNGAEPEAGKENLYLSREGTISFVGTVTQRDVEGEKGATEQVEGLGLWTDVVGDGRLAADPSRVAPDGDVLLFESRANLTGYDPEGHAQIYRYAASGALDCLSCNPTQAPAVGEASLQSIQQVQGGPEPFVSYAVVNNLRADGQRVFFQTDDALVVDDNDGLQDVYEWEGQGVGTCTRSGGCINLISSGHSSRSDYLYAVSDSGNDVFFRTADQLLPRDTESTPSIYDARVGGGFTEGVTNCMLNQECPGPITPGPVAGTPASEAAGPVDNFPATSGKKCKKGTHKVKRNGKVRCVKNKNQSRKQRHRAGTTKKGGRK
jgi:hypothetical protein